MKHKTDLNRLVSCSGHEKNHKPTEPAPTAGFRFMDHYSSQNIAMKYINFRPARIVKGKHHWYVEYQYKNPHGKWQRFKVYENINRFKSDEYNRLLLDAVNGYLEKGYSPFDKKEMNLTAADNSLNRELDNYMIYNQERELSKKSLQTYQSLINTLKEYFTKDNAIYLPVTSFTRADIKAFFDYTKQKEGWKNMTYNKAISQLGTFFLWLIKEGRATGNPCAGIEKKKALPKKHTYFDDNTAKVLKEYMTKHNPYLLAYCEFVYYTAVRPKTEGPQLKIKHLLFDRDLIEMPGAIDKTNRNNYIPMDPELKERLIHLKGKDPDLFIWGNGGPALLKAGHNYFSVQFQKVRKQLKLSDDLTIYSWKHTRAIDLANAGMDPLALMRLFRHTDFGSTMKYLRDLGADIDFTKYDKTRKF